MQEIKINEFGTKRYYLNNQLHRADGPAIEWSNGDKVWYLHGKCHREDGPAIEYPSGSKVWYIGGIHMGLQSYYE